MGCTHPLGIEPIRENGQVVGGLCPVCRGVAYKGDGFWTTLLRAFGFKRARDA